MKKIYKEVWFGVISFIFVISICFQIRIVNKAGTVILDSYGNDELISEIFKWEKRYNDTTKKLDSQNQIIQEYGNVMNTDGDLTKILTQELEESNTLLGLKDLNGQGIIVKIDDSKNQLDEYLAILGIQNQPDEYLDDIKKMEIIKDLIVHDRDVLFIVSSLKAGGAEAICVNDQRIIFSSEIKCVGPVIKVNNEKLAPPYIIKAIGNANEMEDYLNNRSTILNKFKERTLEIEMYKEENVFIPKYNKKISLEYLNQ